MRVVLVFPPLAWPFSPYLGLPALTAHLRGLGHQVIPFDANLKLHDRVFSPAGLELLCAQTQERFRELESRPSLSCLEQEEYLALLEGRSALPQYLDRVEAVKAAFKDIDNYRMLPDGGVPQEKNWFEYKAIRRLALPERTNHLDLPVYSLAAVKTAAAGSEPLFFQPLLEELAAEIAGLDPGLVGFSFTFTEQAIPGLVLAALVKKRLPRAHLVAGGSYFSTLREEVGRILPALDFLDSVVLDEGEPPLAALATALDKDHDLAGVPGLTRRVDGRAVSSAPAPRVDMDELPCPDYSGLPLEGYFAAQPVLPYATARGCYWGRCAFCNFCLISPGFRTRSPRLVARDLNRLAKEHAQLFYFTQDVEPPRRMEDIATAMLEDGVPVRYQLLARFEKPFTRRTAELLKQSGCHYIFFGLETGSDRLNQLMRKGVDLDVARRIVGDCASVGLNVVVSSIRGFPTETPEEWEKTRAFYREMHRAHGHKIRLTGGSHPFRLSRGSSLDREPHQFGIHHIFREAAGELATVFPSYQLEGDPGGSRMLQMQELFLTDYPVILYNEIVVLIITDLAGSDIVRFDVLRPPGSEAPRPPQPLELSGDGGLKLRLAPGVRVERLAFPAARMQRLSRERRRRARALFLTQGLTLEQVAARLDEQDGPATPEPGLLVSSPGEESPRRLGFPARAAPVLDRLAEGETVDGLLAGAADPGVRQRLGALLQELYRQGVVVVEAGPGR